MADEITASDLVHRHLLRYSKSMSFSMFPSVIDGLKPVFRRILVSVNRLEGEFSSVELVSETVKMHPYGNDSIYNAAARLGQSFEYNPKLIDFVGSCGTYAEPRPADMRYTSAALSEFAKDVFFKNVELKVLPKRKNETENGYEPCYLIPSIPTALLYANSSIGYGDSSYTTPHNLADVCDLVVAFCKHQKQSPLTTFDYTAHVEKFIPDFPVYGTLTNYRELLAAYRRGEFLHKVRLDGEVDLEHDSIHIRTLPYGVPFEGLDSKIERLMLEKDSWFDKNIRSVKWLSEENMIGEVCVKLKQSVNVFEAWELLRKKISFSAPVTSITNYNDNDCVVSVSQPSLLLYWYNARYNILVSSKKLTITRLTDEIRRVEARLIICDNIDDVVYILRNNERPVGIERLRDRFDLTFFQASYIAATPMDVLSKTARVELEKKKAELEESLKKLRDSFGKIADEMAAEAMAIKKKYPTPRRTKIPAYVGYVRIGGGCIQFEDVSEINKIIDAFPKGDLEIHMYDGPHLYKVTGEGKLETGHIPKITTGDIYGLRSSEAIKSDRVITVNIVDGVACCVKGFIPGLRAEGYFYTTPISKAICRDGTIKTIEVVKEISLRKTICRGAMTDIIYVYPEQKQDHYVLALNTSTPNVIVIQRVSPEKTKISMNPTGTVYLTHSTSRHFFLNVPQQYLNRNATRVVEFLDLEKVLDGKSSARLYIGSQEVKTNKSIRLL